MIKKWFCVLFFAVMLLACAPADDAEVRVEPFTLTIAHINDTHSAFDPVRTRFWLQDTVIYNEFGGHPRILERINQYRAEAQREKQPLLFLHGGDAWQGSAYFQINEGRMNADILSRMGIDAMALGNHEFDLNNRLLNEFLDTINFPVLAANIDTSADHDLRDQGNLKPFVVFAFEGDTKERLEQVPSQPDGRHWVGVFGIALDDMPNISPNTGDVVFFDMVTSAQATVDTLTALGVQKIIAVTHVGHAIDLHIASRVNGIDAIVGGHSHTLLGDFTNLNLGDGGTYAAQVVNPDGQGWTCVVQAGEYAQAIGRVHLTFDAQGSLSACQGGNTLLSNDTFYRANQRTVANRLEADAHQEVVDFIEQQANIAIVPEDRALRSHIDTVYKPALERAYGEVIGIAPRTLKHVRRPGDAGSDVHGSEVAPLVAHAQFWWASRDEITALTGLPVDFSLVGAGGIRMPIPEGEVREGDITLELLPFSNALAVVPLRGADVVHLLTDIIHDTLPTGSHAGKFPYGGNLRYVFVEQQAERFGEIIEIEVNRGTLYAPTWEPLESDAIYNVVMNAYNATGNDGWTWMYEVQREGSGRVDLAYQDGELQAFPVERVIERDGRLHVVYSEQEAVCDHHHIRCDTDALAVVEFIRKQWTRVEALPYPTVTLRRAN